MITAIIGSRNITAFDFSKVISPETTEIVSGGARGVDTLASDYACSHNIKLTVFLPNYNKFGKPAPIIRNKQIIDYCDNVIAVWNGVSRGTQFTLNYAKKQSKPINLIVINSSETH